MADPVKPNPWRDEWEIVRRWRFNAAKNAGLNFDDASAFADGTGDIAELRSLQEHGATPDQIRRICI